MAAPLRPVPFRRTAAFFRRHPILLLLCFTPGIPEYLSGSSSFALTATLPGLVIFVLFLGLNLGIYGPGVLLAREAFVRWRPGWAGMVLIGSAYGLLEEGTALSTLFNPHASVVGGFGEYGRFAGVNWVWLVGVLGVHIVYSVGLPILLLGLAVPATRGRPLLARRGIVIALLVYAVDIGILAAIVGYWRTAPGLLLGAALVAGLFYALARTLRPGTLDPRGPGPRIAAKWFFAIGFVFYPVLVLVPGLAARAELWPPATVVLELLIAMAFLLSVRREVGRAGNEAALAMLALGTIAPLMGLGLLFQLAWPVVLFPDVLAGLFFYTLWRRYGPGPAMVPAPPVGAT